MHPVFRSIRPVRLGAALGAVGVGATMFASTGAAVSRHAPDLPTRVTATKLGAVHRPFATVGTKVASSNLGQRVFANGADGYSLASLNRGGGAQYPAHTTDGGKVWRVAGPYFHVNAADAPDAIGAVGLATARTAFFYGGPYFGNDVDTTSNAGGAWYRARFADPVLAVSYEGGSHGPRLVAFLVGHPADVYTSTDGGRVWTLSTSSLT